MYCGGGWDDTRGAEAWKCSGRRWPGFGLLKRCAYSSLSLACFSGFLRGLVCPNCGDGFLSSCRGFGASAGASVRGGCGAGGSRSRTILYGFWVDREPSWPFAEVACGTIRLKCHLAKVNMLEWGRSHGTYCGLMRELPSSKRLLESPRYVTERSSKKELSFSASFRGMRFAASV